MAVGGRGLGKISFMSATQNGKRSRKLDCKMKASGMHLYMYAPSRSFCEVPQNWLPLKKGKVKVYAHLSSDVSNYTLANTN
jgi:hypothetical protein